MNIQVEPDIAAAYNQASGQDQKKIQILLRLCLQELSRSPNMSLSEMMDMLSDRAQARGLTPEELESILSATDENETSYLLKSPANRNHLLKAIENVADKHNLVDANLESLK